MVERGNVMPGGDPASLAADFAKRHHLGGPEFAKACEVLAPAFALALARAAEAPERWAELSRSLTMDSGPPQADRLDRFLDAVFGGGAIREAVARQASAMSGVASGVVAAAMPQLAALGAEAMMRAAASGFSSPRGTQLPTDAFGPFAAEMMRRGANAVEAFSRPSGASRPSSVVGGGPWFANPFLEAFAGALSAKAAASPTPTNRSPVPGAGENPMFPFAAMFDAFAMGMRSGPSPSAPAAPQESASPSDLLDGFARSGQRFREDYAKGMAALFESFPRTGRASP